MGCFFVVVIFETGPRGTTELSVKLQQQINAGNI